MHAFMIVYIKSESRVQNYRDNKHTLTVADLKCFEAVDTINEWDRYYSLAIEQNTHHLAFLNNNLRDGKKFQMTIKGKGALGCDLSHLFIYRQMIEQLQYDDDYCLIMEDDAVITSQFNDDALSVIDHAVDKKSDYVHLATNPKFIDKQFDSTNRLTDLLYKMIPQWHTTCQLVSKRGAQTLLDNIVPMNTVIDFAISTCIDKLNATACQLRSVKNKGAENEHNQTSQFGSLIFNDGSC